VIRSTVTTEEERGKGTEKKGKGSPGGMAMPPPQPPAKLYAPLEAHRSGMLKVLLPCTASLL